MEVINPQSDPRYKRYWTTYHEIMERSGVSPSAARTIVRTSNTAIAALAVKLGDADAMLCGLEGGYRRHLAEVCNVIGKGEGVWDLSAMSLLILSERDLFPGRHLRDRQPERRGAGRDDRAGRPARAALRPGAQGRPGLPLQLRQLLRPCAQKVREAMAMLHRDHPDLEVEGEMHADMALNEKTRERLFPNSRLKGAANLLIMPSLDAAHIAFNLVKAIDEGLSVGPILIGTDKPAHILTNSVTARGVLNMTAVAVADAQDRVRD